jgi:hypothetical protein
VHLCSIYSFFCLRCSPPKTCRVSRTTRTTVLKDENANARSRIVTCSNPVLIRSNIQSTLSTRLTAPTLSTQSLSLPRTSSKVSTPLLHSVSNSLMPSIYTRLRHFRSRLSASRPGQRSFPSPQQMQADSLVYSPYSPHPPAAGGYTLKPPPNVRFPSRAAALCLASSPTIAPTRGSLFKLLSQWRSSLTSSAPQITMTLAIPPTPPPMPFQRSRMMSSRFWEALSSASRTVTRVNALS